MDIISGINFKSSTFKQDFSKKRELTIEDYPVTIIDDETNECFTHGPLFEDQIVKFLKSKNVQPLPHTESTYSISPDEEVYKYVLSFLNDEIKLNNEINKNQLYNINGISYNLDLVRTNKDLIIHLKRYFVEDKERFNVYGLTDFNLDLNTGKVEMAVGRSKLEHMHSG